MFDKEITDRASTNNIVGLAKLIAAFASVPEKDLLNAHLEAAASRGERKFYIPDELSVNSFCILLSMGVNVTRTVELIPEAECNIATVIGHIITW